MPVPAILKANAHVFCYSADLLDASNTLAGYLNCNVSKVYNNNFAPGAETSKVAWLVGHGMAENDSIWNKAGTKGLTIESICDWLHSCKTYTHVVDTCCNPNLRKISQTFKSSYYCTNDNECVQVITSYPTFDAWWDASHMHQFVANLKKTGKQRQKRSKA